MGVLITYDVPHSHVELKKRMIAKGYSKTVIGTKNGVSTTYNLPNTTLWKDIPNSCTALEDVKACTKGLVSIERVIAVEFTTFCAEIGIPL